MLSQHSPTPWAERFEGSCQEIADAKGEYVGNTFNDNARDQENAARIVACVNACEGISNEQIEALPVSELVLQRDELLAALKGILSVVRIRINDPRACQLKAARAAIRKAEGAKHD